MYCKVILKHSYSSYENALATIHLKKLSERRLMLCKRFAKKCLKKEKSKDMFPLNPTKNKDKYNVNFAKHSRLLDSAIPQMQRLLNKM